MDKKRHPAAEAVEEIRVYRAQSVPFTDLRGKTIADVAFGHAGTMPGKGIYEAVVLTVADGTGYVVWEGHGEVNLSRLEEIK
jgi:hypothetical protein